MAHACPLFDLCLVAAAILAALPAFSDSRKARLANLGRAELIKLIGDHFDRDEVGILWYDLFDQDMDDELPYKGIDFCAMQLVRTAHKTGNFEKLLDRLCEDDRLADRSKQSNGRSAIPLNLAPGTDVKTLFRSLNRTTPRGRVNDALIDHADDPVCVYVSSSGKDDCHEIFVEEMLDTLADGFRERSGSFQHLFLDLDLSLKETNVDEAWQQWISRHWRCRWSTKDPVTNLYPHIRDIAPAFVLVAYETVPGKKSLKDPTEYEQVSVAAVTQAVTFWAEMAKKASDVKYHLVFLIDGFDHRQHRNAVENMGVPVADLGIFPPVDRDVVETWWTGNSLSDWEDCFYDEIARSPDAVPMAQFRRGFANLAERK